MVVVVSDTCCVKAKVKTVLDDSTSNFKRHGSRLNSCFSADHKSILPTFFSGNVFPLSARQQVSSPWAFRPSPPSLFVFFWRRRQIALNRRRAKRGICGEGRNGFVRRENFARQNPHHQSSFRYFPPSSSSQTKHKKPGLFFPGW